MESGDAMKTALLAICLFLIIILFGVAAIGVSADASETSYAVEGFTQQDSFPAQQDNTHEAEIRQGTSTAVEADSLSSQPDEPQIRYQEHSGLFELPISGAAGWATYNLPLKNYPGADAKSMEYLSAGQGFTILEELGDWWYIELDSGASGWVENSGCFINLPDVIPSIVYDITNSYSSLKQSSGFDIPNVSGQALYQAWSFNARLGRHEFVVPALYPMSKKIAAAQADAIADGNTIIIYEAFRPYETQQLVSHNLGTLIASNESVRNVINTPPWSISWFIATSLSNHQRGAAIDVSLGQIITKETGIAAGFAYTRILEFVEYEMPSAIHELSPLAADYDISDYPSAAVLKSYFVKAGFEPIASEWWHFSDYDSVGVASQIGINGAFFVDTA